MKILQTFNTWATFVMFYLVVWGCVADTGSLKRCEINFFYPRHVELCHKPNVKTADQCKEGQGFVLHELVIAPMSEYDDCGPFHNNDLLDAKCLREKIVNYDERVFEVLKKISGQNKIDNGTTVERFEFSLAGSDMEGGGGGSAEEDSSAFVSLNRQCRPADPDKSEYTMVNMCANMTVEDFRVYLTLQDTEDIPSNASFCRCVITPYAEMHVKALDVRLQNVKDDGQRCGPSALKIESNESRDSGSRDLKCEGKKALYGFHQLHTSSKDKEVILTLTSVDTNHFPTAVWIEVVQEYDQSASRMTVACEGFVPMTETVVPAREDSKSHDNSSVKAVVDKQTNIGTFLGAGVGALAALTLMVTYVFLLVRRYNSRLQINTDAHVEESRDTTNTLLPAVPDRPDFQTCRGAQTEEADQTGHYRASTSSAYMELMENPPVYNQLAMQRNQHIYSGLHQH